VNPEVTRRLVLAAARVCRWPPVRLATVELSDRGAWEHAADRATPAERVQLIVALEPHLLRATEGGQARLAGQRHHPPDVDDEAYVVGDAAALPLVRAALALLPEPPRSILRREVAFLAVGVTSAGWCCSARFVDAAGNVKQTVINVGPAMSIELLLHELGHAWTRPLNCDLSVAVSVQGEEAFRAYMRREPETSAQMARSDRDAEVVANALALSWLYSEPQARALPA
jgi:hypothetical protein